MKNLLKLADKFLNIVAQTAPAYDPDLHRKVLNLPPNKVPPVAPNEANANFAWATVANIVMQDLTKLDQNEADAGITGANHALMDMLNNFTSVPDPQKMLSAANDALTKIKRSAPNDAQKIQVASYLVNLTKIIINKYFGN